ncbi:hypothetical protein [Pseudactinotalea sp. Z1748]|uniref:hypothetical protein n=1 Tax=Pseudactinotalea sp. Z1748 TaxID=3413027 RepID=UPI003C7999B6
MANPSKAKGDRAEREAVAFLIEQSPPLVVPRAMRKLGAGRKEDTGDLHVFTDVAIQVRNLALKDIGLALRSAATDAVAQARNGDLDYALGLVPYPRARSGTVRWIASWLTSPADLGDEAVEFKMVSKALDWVRDDEGPYGYLTRPRQHRVAHLTGTGTPVMVAPYEAWLARYVLTRTGTPPVFGRLTTAGRVGVA